MLGVLSLKDISLLWDLEYARDSSATYKWLPVLFLPLTYCETTPPFMPLIPTWDWPDTQGAARLTLIESWSQQHELENGHFSLSRYVISFTASLKLDHQNGNDTFILGFFHSF